MIPRPPDEQVRRQALQQASGDEVARLEGELERAKLTRDAGVRAAREHGHSLRAIGKVARLSAPTVKDIADAAPPPPVNVMAQILANAERPPESGEDAPVEQERDMVAEATRPPGILTDLERRKFAAIGAQLADARRLYGESTHDGLVPASVVDALCGSSRNSKRAAVELLWLAGAIEKRVRAASLGPGSQPRSRAGGQAS